MTVTEPYATGRTYLDADSHVVETPQWLEPFADPAIRERIRRTRPRQGWRRARPQGP